MRFLFFSLFLSPLFVLSPLIAQERLDDLGQHLDAIKADADVEVRTIGLIFNPEDVDIEGAKVGVKTLAVPATNGPQLITHARNIIGRVEAVYLIKGKSVTTPKFAKFVAKLAGRKGVGVYTNDPDLEGLEGIQLIRPNGTAFVVN